MNFSLSLHCVKIKADLRYLGLWELNNNKPPPQSTAAANSRDPTVTDTNVPYFQRTPVQKIPVLLDMPSSSYSTAYRSTYTYSYLLQ
jgi:hypothetical protein